MILFSVSFLIIEIVVWTASFCPLSGFFFSRAVCVPFSPVLNVLFFFSSVYFIFVLCLLSDRAESPSLRRMVYRRSFHAVSRRGCSVLLCYFLCGLSFESRSTCTFEDKHVVQCRIGV